MAGTAFDRPPRALAALVSPLRGVAVLGLDAALTSASFWITMLLRFEGHIPQPYRLTLVPTLTLLVCFRLLAVLLFRVHRWSFRLSGLADGARIGMANVFGTGLLVGTFFLLRDPGPPRSVVVLELLLTTWLMALLRFSPRLAGLYFADWRRGRREVAARTLILGAGAAGEMLLRDLQRARDHRYHVVGFLDDDPAKWNLVVGGKTVLGGIDELRGLVREYQVATLLIAIPRLDPRRIHTLLALCADLKLRFKILPPSFLHEPARSAAVAMQDLAPEDLLPRPAVRIGGGLPVELAGRTALVTGAAGSLGSEICTQLAHGGVETIVLVDLAENGLYLLTRRLEREAPGVRLCIEIADVRDAARIDALFRRYRPHDVFHAAAHKHVPLLEIAPAEAVKNNVLGTLNVARAADRGGTERFVYMSTDKAVRPTSVMGASKRVGEELVRALGRGSATRFTAVRFGNVLGSAGSVVPLFREQIAAGGPVSVTHPEVRRYFMTVAEAVALVLHAAYGDYGELCVLDMGEQIRIVDLARHMITMAGLVPDVDVPIVFTGLRPGEKLCEELLTEDEERTRRVERKIFVADCPAPAADLEPRVAALARAAEEEQEQLVVALLREIVPSYVPTGRPLAAPPSAARGRGAARPGAAALRLERAAPGGE